MDAQLYSWYTNKQRNAPALLVAAGSVSHDERHVMTTSIISPETDNLKRCTKCGEVKPREAFSRNIRQSDGLQSQCKKCNREYDLLNAKRIAERKHNHQIKHSKRIAERKREYRQLHAERIAQYQHEYRRKYGRSDAGKLVESAYNHRRRARILDCGGTHTTEDLQAIRAAQTDKRGRLICWRCGKPIKGAPHLDHWIPLAKGGTNDAGNLHYMHARCNLSKSAKMPAEIGRLI